MQRLSGIEPRALPWCLVPTPFSMEVCMRSFHFTRLFLADGARFCLVRVNFINNVQTGQTRKLYSLGLAFSE